jgi:hypothetical protein
MNSFGAFVAISIATVLILCSSRLSNNNSNASLLRIIVPNLFIYLFQYTYSPNYSYPLPLIFGTEVLASAF